MKLTRIAAHLTLRARLALLLLLCDSTFFKSNNTSACFGMMCKPKPMNAISMLCAGVIVDVCVASTTVR